MIEGIPSLSALERAAGVRRTPVRAEEVRRQEPVEGLLDPFPEEPPAEVLESLDKAQQVLAELKSKQINLQFRVDEEANRIEVVVRDGSGHILRAVPANDALEILAGEKPVGLGFEARG